MLGDQMRLTNILLFALLIAVLFQTPQSWGSRIIADAVLRVDMWQVLQANASLKRRQDECEAQVPARRSTADSFSDTALRDLDLRICRNIQ